MVFKEKGKISINSKNIDIVYLWVDGSDSNWSLKKKKTKLELGLGDKLSPYGNVEGRYRDNQELRYSLRALELFFPDHGHVYIITDEQRPTWIKNSEIVTIVDHRELIPPHLLPTFDSANIESYVHQIPNLSERYFYFNDDVFFGKPVNVDDWFFDGGIYLSWSNESEVIGSEIIKTSDPLSNASRLSKKFLQNKKNQIDNKLLPSSTRKIKKNYTHTPRTFSHSPRPMLRSLIQDIEDEFQELFALIRTTRFRQWDKPTLISDFVLRYALAHDLAYIKDYSFTYIETGCSSAKEEYYQLIDQIGSLDFFCLNDTTDNASSECQSLEDARNSLQIIFPVSSKFEFV